jgi:cell division protein FtsA
MLKVRYGGVNRDLIRADQMIQVTGVGNNPLTLSRMDLADIIIARYEEIFEEVRRLLADSGAIHVLRHGVVLSGASCQIEGIVSLARNALGVPVHLGNHPASVEIRDDRKPLLHRTIFATASGLGIATHALCTRQSAISSAKATASLIAATTLSILLIMPLLMPRFAA